MIMRYLLQLLGRWRRRCDSFDCRARQADIARRRQIRRRSSAQPAEHKRRCYDNIYSIAVKTSPQRDAVCRAEPLMSFADYHHAAKMLLHISPADTRFGRAGRQMSRRGIVGASQEMRRVIRDIFISMPGRAQHFDAPLLPQGRRLRGAHAAATSRCRLRLWADLRLPRDAAKKRGHAAVVRRV